MGVFDDLLQEQRAGSQAVAQQTQKDSGFFSNVPSISSKKKETKEERRERLLQSFGNLLGGKQEKTHAQIAFERQAGTFTPEEPVSFRTETKDAYKSSVSEITGDLNKIKSLVTSDADRQNPKGQALRGAKGLLALMDLGVDVGIGAGKTLFAGLASGVADITNVSPEQFRALKKGTVAGAEVAPFVISGSSVAKQVAKGLPKTLGKRVFQDILGNLTLDALITAADNPERFEAADAANILGGNLIGAGIQAATGGLVNKKALKETLKVVNKDLQTLRGGSLLNKLGISDSAKKEMVFNNPYKVKLIDDIEKSNIISVFHGRGRIVKDFSKVREGDLFFTADKEVAAYYGGTVENVTEARIDIKDFLDLSSRTKKAKFVRDNFTEEEVFKLFPDFEVPSRLSEEASAKFEDNFIKRQLELLSQENFTGGERQKLLLSKLRSEGYPGVRLEDNSVGEKGIASDISYVVFDRKKILNNTPDRSIASVIKEAEDNSIGSPGLVSDFYSKESIKRYKDFSPEKSKAESKFSKTVGDWITPLSDKIEKIAPSMFRRVRKLEQAIRVNPQKDIEIITPFVKKMNKLSKGEDILAKIAALNGDDKAIVDIMKRNKIDPSLLSKSRESMDSVHKLQADSGIDIGYSAGYFPRNIRDHDGLMNYLSGSETGSIIERALSKKKAFLGRDLLEHERKAIIDTQMRGFQTGNLTLSKEGFMKSRNIGKITPEMATFYEDPFKGLVNNILKAHEAVEVRKLFGKKSKELTSEYTKRSRLATRMAKAKSLKEGDRGFADKNKKIDEIASLIDETDNNIGRLTAVDKQAITENVGSLVDDMLSKGEIKAGDEIELKELLISRFNPASTPSFIATGKEIVYLSTLPNPMSAVTQLGDLFLSSYKNGLFETVGALVQKSKITLKDLGIANIAAELSDKGKLSKLLERTLKASGFSSVDALGKTTFINASYKRLTKKANNPNVEFVNGIQRVFGDNSEQVIKDLQNGVISEDVKFLLFNNILDVQPIALSDMPKKYLQSGGSRILYTLKSFTIRQLNFARRETVDIIKNGIKNKDKKEILRGSTNLMKLGAALAAQGVSTDAIKSLMSNRDYKIDDIPDSIASTLLRVVLINKYNLGVGQLKQKGVQDIAANILVPPTQMIGDAVKDSIALFEGKIRGLKDVKSIKNVPVGGKLYYWWLGEGAEKTKRRGENIF